MLRTLVMLLATAIVLSGCASGGGLTYADGERKILYGTDSNGNPLFRRVNQPPARAPASHSCLRTYCKGDADDQLADAINER